MSAPAAAAVDNTRLGIIAVGQKAAFFDLSMAPGDKRVLSVDLTNDSTEPIAALTYAADVYTIVNGGFGARLRGQPATGTTNWLNYPTDVLQLQPAKALRRTFTVSVPVDASPGDYITSLVVENQNSIQGSGGVTLNQIVRHALAVAIAIPGPRHPALHISSAAHSLVAGRSVVAIAVENPGNARLKPAGDFRLLDASGLEVSHARVTMDSFYAQTSTHVEVPLAAQLQPGHYTAVLSLTDAGTGLSVTSDPLPFEVVAPPTGSGGVVGRVPGLAPILQAHAGGIPVWLLAAAIAAVMLAGVLLTLGARSLRRRRADPATANRLPGRERAPAPGSAARTLPSNETQSPGGPSASDPPPAALVATPPLDSLEAIEVEVTTPRRFGLLVVPGQPCVFAREGEVIINDQLSSQEMAGLLESAGSLVTSHGILETEPLAAERAFDPQALAQPSVHLRVRYGSGRQWASCYLGASPPNNVWAFCQSVQGLGLDLARRLGEPPRL